MGIIINHCKDAPYWPTSIMESRKVGGFLSWLTSFCSWFFRFYFFGILAIPVRCSCFTACNWQASANFDTRRSKGFTQLTIFSFFFIQILLLDVGLRLFFVQVLCVGHCWSTMEVGGWLLFNRCQRAWVKSPGPGSWKWTNSVPTSRQMRAKYVSRWAIFFLMST